MTKPLRTQFVIADGSRARWVRRSDHANDFVTTRDVEAEERPDGEPQGVVFEGSTRQRFSIPESNQAVLEHRARFARQLAEEINAAAAQDQFDRLVVVAPGRTLSEITRRLSQPATTRLARTLTKDLTKTPDHELMTWLRPLEHG